MRRLSTPRFDGSGQWAEPVERWDEEVDERLDASAALPVLRSALDALPERQRHVVLLRDVEGLSSEEACAVLGDPSRQPANPLAPRTRCDARAVGGRI